MFSYDTFKLAIWFVCVHDFTESKGIVIFLWQFNKKNGVELYVIIYLRIWQTYEVFNDAGQAVAAMFMLALKKLTLSLCVISVLLWEIC